MNVHQTWRTVLTTGEMRKNTMKKVEIRGHTVLLVNSSGKFYALSHLCTHDDIDLSLGCIEANSIKCALHGAAFDLQTGKVLADPAERPLTTWQVRIKDDKVQICI